MRRSILLVLTLSACKSDSKPTPAAPPAEPTAPVDAVREIAQQPRTAMAGKTGFLELTIDLPPAASMPMKGVKATSWTFKDSKLELEVTEQGTQPSQEPPMRPPVQRKTTHTVTREPNGYLVVEREPDETRFAVEYCRDLDPTQPPSGICCKLSLASPRPIAGLDDVITFAEQVCRSIKVQNRTMP